MKTCVAEGVIEAGDNIYLQLISNDVGFCSPSMLLLYENLVLETFGLSLCSHRGINLSYLSVRIGKNGGNMKTCVLFKA